MSTVVTTLEGCTAVYRNHPGQRSNCQELPALQHSTVHAHAQECCARSGLQASTTGCQALTA